MIFKNKDTLIKEVLTDFLNTTDKAANADDYICIDVHGTYCRTKDHGDFIVLNEEERVKETQRHLNELYHRFIEGINIPNAGDFNFTAMIDPVEFRKQAFRISNATLNSVYGIGHSFKVLDELVYSHHLQGEEDNPYHIMKLVPLDDELAANIIKTDFEAEYEPDTMSKK